MSEAISGIFAFTMAPAYRSAHAGYLLAAVAMIAAMRKRKVEWCVLFVLFGCWARYLLGVRT
jgi:hypothetical protein